MHGETVKFICTIVCCYDLRCRSVLLH